MSESMDQTQKYNKRMRYRTLMARLGLGVASCAGIIFFVGIALLLLTDVLSNQLSSLIGVSQYGIAFGIIFALIFGRLGWSDKVVIDFLLNRISSILAILGATIITIGDIKYHSSTLIWTGSFICVAGVFLAFLGIRYHKTPANEIFQEIKKNQ